MGGGRRLLHVASGPTSLRARPDENSEEVGRVPPDVIVEALLEEGAGAGVSRPDGTSGSLAWARLVEAPPRPPWAPSPCGGTAGVAGREAWLLVDGLSVRQVGGRDVAGSVWLDRALLPRRELADEDWQASAGSRDDACGDAGADTDGYAPDGCAEDIGAGIAGACPEPLAPLRAALLRSPDGCADARGGGPLERLEREGYAVVDGALPPELCRELRAELDALLENDQMWGSESFSDAEGALHRSIVETTMDYRNVRDFAPTFAKIEGDRTLIHVLRRLPALRRLDIQHLRMQVNKGNGGCYTMHTDSAVMDGGGGGRHILKATALMYLNADWREADGGELRLYPFPRPPISLAPLEGRLVLFEPRMVHEVLPCFRQRYCFTLWCAAVAGTCEHEPANIDRVTDMAEAAELVLNAVPAGRRRLPERKAAALPRELRTLFLAEVRPLLVRYVFRAREVQAATRSHEEGAQKQAMLRGIAGYHAAMEAQNPSWLRDLLEALPASCGGGIGLAAPDDGSRGSGCGGRVGAREALPEGAVGPAEVAEIMCEFCPWWD